MQLSEIITHFKNVKPNGDNSYMACCPYHGDEHQSLSISEKDGKILLNCFAGCDYHNVLWAAGLQGKDLFNDAASQNNPIIPKPPSVEYLYTSDLKKVRFYLKNNNGSWRKSFCWKHHDDQGNWQKGMGGVRPPLYRQEVLETARQKTFVSESDDGDLFDEKAFNTVFIAEGEKDVDTIVGKLGLKAVCSPHGGTSGAIESKWRSEYNPLFEGLDVAIIPDNDEVGRQFALMVARQILPFAKSVKVLDLTEEWEDLPEKGDITDVYEREQSLNGNSIAETVRGKLEALTIVTPVATPACRGGQSAQPTFESEDESNARVMTRRLSDVTETSALSKAAPDATSRCWSAPISLDMPDLPGFPIEALPDIVRNYALELSESIQTPVDMCASACLAVLALAVQGKHKIRGKSDWFEPLNLYVLNIAYPSERKSSVLSAVLKPVYTYESEYNERNAQAIQQSYNELNVLKKKQQNYVDKIASIESGKQKDSSEETAAAVRQKLAETTEQLLEYQLKKPKKLHADDITSEKLVDLLDEYDGRMSVISTEGGLFDIISGTYNKNTNIDVFLKAWSGDYIRVDRMGRPSNSIFNPALTILMMLQPHAISGLLNNQKFRGRGLTARFLYCMPQSLVGHRRYRTEPIGEFTKQDYKDLLFALLDDDANEIRYIKLSDEADKLLEEFSERLEPTIPKEAPMVAEWMGKLVGTVLRIAGIICLAETAAETLHEFYAEGTENPIVSGDTMQGAIALGEYYLKHAQAAFMLMGEDDVTDKTKTVLAKIKETGLKEFNNKKILDVCRSFKKVADIRPALERLTEFGWLKEIEPEYSGKGRRPDVKYLVNPMLFDENEAAESIRA